MMQASELAWVAAEFNIDNAAAGDVSNSGQMPVIIIRLARC